MTLPAAVEAVCRTFLAEAPPGLVTGLHLRGGVAFGEWVPGGSDIDFVATLAHRPSGEEVEALRAAHERVALAHPDHPFDGPHLLVEDLTRDPALCPDVPSVMHHHFEDEAPVGDAMVAWHELARHGITVLGTPHTELGIWTSQPALLEFTRANLDTYWRSTAEALAAMPQEGASEEACCWCVLGVARLHHLLVTGEMTTKSAAGRWGLTHYPERFHRVLGEALRIRDGIRVGAGSESPVEYPAAERGQDTADFTAYVVAEGVASP
ncbi:aminoglycoside adenylyltransferase domain-containing protein [Nocardioides sp.]|uniref:aminoglycoside adenylyltransferase domain-containing protein n=1 Tax=Nocardioides sp. TaxID=35761 RepID=UPI003564DE4D